MGLPFSYEILFSFGVMGLFLLVLSYAASRHYFARITFTKVVLTLLLGCAVSLIILDESLPLGVRYGFLLSSISLYYSVFLFFASFSRSTE